MMDMIERVARALCAENGTIWGGPRGENEPDFLPIKVLYLSLARAAIEAMRTPDQAMQDAGYVVTVDDAVEVWETMIDAALKP